MSLHAASVESITRDCEQLVFRAARYTDLARWEELAALFAEDARLVRPSDPQNPIVGRHDILISMRMRPPRVNRHVVSNVLVQIHSATSAHISSIATLFSGAVASTGTGPVPVQKIAIGNFEDDVVMSDGRWHFTLRDGSMALEMEQR